MFKRYRYRHYHIAGVGLAALVVALSCGRSSDEETNRGAPPAASSSPRKLESDFVGLGDDDDATEHLVTEQSFQPQDEPAPATTIPPKRAKLIVTTTKELEKDNVRIAPQPPPRREPIPEPVIPGPQYNPRSAVVVVPPPAPPPPKRTPLAPVPPREDDRSRVTASDVAIGVGTASMITGAAAAAGDGNEGARVFGISMLGIGLASYATAGILSLHEQSEKKQGKTTISVGPGFIRGTF